MANTVGKISGQMLESNLLRRDMQTGDENLAFDTDLIFIDVFNNRIGIKTDTPFRPLLVNSVLSSTNFIVDTVLTTPNFTISSNTIDLDSGNIELSANGIGAEIQSTGIQTGNLKFDQNEISNLVLNQDIDLNPSGLGKVNFYNELRIDGDLHATGDIVADGNVTLGSDDTDNIIFNAKIGSDIIPDQTNTYSIGNSTKQFDTLYTYLINGQTLTSGGAVVDGIDLSTRPGNTWFVSADNGNNTNVGDHPNGPFATIEWALSVATSGDTVLIYPGTYVELFPLVVPTGVTVKGAGIRDTKIVPDTASTHEDVFKLNGETTVEDLTVADYYYDNLLDKGYAFSFDNNFNVSSRSPYIRNVTVITKGSVTSISDPRGFDEGDAGRGAKIDGALALSTSIEATMLFHSATFITPGADCIIMKNGVRVEWLNSFIYFADKGLYALNGSTGFANLGTKFGAEVRSIGSANVYGNYGAYADGDEVLMYLISHNFGYIGSGKESNNDPTNVIQANETVRLNNGTIYFQSMDHIGDFRVGDVFRVQSSTGNIEFQTSVVSNSSINLTDGVNTTFIDATEVLTGNIKIYGNTIESIVQDINLDAANNTIDITSNFDINSNLYVGNSASVSSDVIFGSLNTDFLEVNSKISSDLIPSNNTLDVGNTGQSWNNLYASSLLFDNIAIYNNVIETKISNSDLELRSNGTGNILATSDITVGQDFVAQGSVNFAYLTLSNLLSNNLVVDNLVTISTKTTFDDIDFLGNRITTTVSNADLELIANGTGSVVINGDSLLLGQNLSVNGFSNLLDTNINGLLTASSVVTNQVNASNLVLDTIVIAGNTVNTVVSNSDLELRANGTGNVIVNDSLIVNQNLTINGASNLKDTNVLGTVSTSNIFSTNYISSELIGDTISVQGNVIKTTVSNADLELRANGTGSLIVEDSLTASQDLFVNGTASLLNATANTLNLFSNTVATTIVTNFFDNGQILIDDNFISTTQSNANLELYANNLGGVIFDQTLQFTSSTISNVLLSGTEFERSINFTPQSGYQFNINSTSALKLPVGSNTNRVLSSNGEIRYNNINGSFEGRLTGGTKSISGLYDLDRNTYITAELTPGANDNTIRMATNGVVQATITDQQVQVNTLRVDEIEINNNVIRTINSNADIILDTSSNIPITLDNPNAYSTSASDQFGFHLDASPSYIIAGAAGEDNSSGVAYIYNTAGTLLFTLTNPNVFGTSANDLFGQAVAITESYAIVGAPTEDTATTSSSGRAYIYSTATGTLLHTLTMPTPVSSRQFGVTVGISESYSIVGCYAGSSVFIYSNATGALLHTITVPLGSGRSVDITDSYAIIGAPNVSPASTGRAFIYNSSTGTLLYTLTNTIPSPAASYFGSQVSLSDSYAVVTAPG